MVCGSVTVQLGFVKESGVFAHMSLQQPSSPQIAFANAVYSGFGMFKLDLIEHTLALRPVTL